MAWLKVSYADYGCWFPLIIILQHVYPSSLARISSSGGIRTHGLSILRSVAPFLTSFSSPSIQSTIVSRVHFRIYSIIYDDDLITEFPPLIYCEDRQSSNGTYINDTLIGTISSPRSPYLLSNGDVISIRPHWTFHFHQKKQTNGRNLDDLQSQELEVLLLYVLFVALSDFPLSYSRVDIRLVIDC